MRIDRNARNSYLPHHAVTIRRQPIIKRPQLKAGRANSARRPKSAVHWFALACVWLAFTASAFVFREPAPVDVLFLGLIVLLPAVGLIKINAGLILYMALWFIIAAGHFLASANALDVATAARFSGVTLFLAIGSFITAAFVANRPQAHTQLILGAWTGAALIATTLALIGYTGVVPSLETLFTKFGRASGSFKDPNVFGAFLIAPILYMLHLSITRPLTRTIGPLCIAGILLLGVLLCFSRGAWANLAAAIPIFGYLAFVTAPGTWQRARITSFVSIGILVGISVIAVAMQFDYVTNLLFERASLVQSYDSGHEGRFGGQFKAASLIAQHPLGIGANEFGTRYHHEEVHNVYLSVILNGGWVGGAMYWVLTTLTIVLGLRHALRRTSTQPIFLVVLAAFIATALEGLIVDTDHWRHFYFLMALCWGLMTAHQHDENPTAARGKIVRSRGSIALAPNSLPRRNPRVLHPA